MDTNQEILNQLQKINRNLDTLNHPGKKIFSSLLAGIFHSIGTVLGTIILVSVLIYLFSKFNINKSISSWIEETLSQIKWEKVIIPQINTIEKIQDN